MPKARTYVLVVGSLHYDIVVKTDRLPRKDETGVGDLWYPKFGGKGGNQAVACALSGAKTRMFGAVGKDDFGSFLRAGLADGAVDARFVRQITGIRSGMSVAIVDAAGDYAATIVSGANLHISPEWLDDPQVWDGVGLLILQNEVPEAVNLAAARHARHLGIRTVLNAAPCRPLSRDFCTFVDILVVNAVEAEMMGADPVCCLQTAADAACKLAETFDAVIVTAGSKGLAAKSADEEPFQLAAEKVTVASSHGAGDAFIGALAAGLLAERTLHSACHGASLAAARHVAGDTQPL